MSSEGCSSCGDDEALPYNSDTVIDITPPHTNTLLIVDATPPDYDPLPGSDVAFEFTVQNVGLPDFFNVEFIYPNGFTLMIEGGDGKFFETNQQKIYQVHFEMPSTPAMIEINAYTQFCSFDPDYPNYNCLSLDDTGVWTLTPGSGPGPGPDPTPIPWELIFGVAAIIGIAGIGYGIYSGAIKLPDPMAEAKRRIVGAGKTLRYG